LRSPSKSSPIIPPSQLIQLELREVSKTRYGFRRSADGSNDPGDKYEATAMKSGCQLADADPKSFKRFAFFLA
jgi:hypothetical protein